MDKIFRVRVERICQAGRRIEPGDVIARLSADAVCPSEIAAHQNLAVRLHRDRIDTGVRVRVERICQAGDGIEPGDAVTGLSADGGRSEACLEGPPTKILPSACTAIVS